MRSLLTRSFKHAHTHTRTDSKTNQMDKAIQDQQVHREAYRQSIEDLRNAGGGSRANASSIISSQQQLEQLSTVLRGNHEQWSTKKRETGDSLRSTKARLQSLEQELHRRKVELEERCIKADDEHSVVLQVEATLVQLSQENEVTERTLFEKEKTIDERLVRLNARETELSQSVVDHQNKMRDQRERQESLHAAVEAGWRQLDEAVVLQDSQHATEVGRLQRLQKDVEDRDDTLRRQQNELQERQHHLNSRIRHLESHRNQLAGLDRTAVDRMRGELKEREALVHQS